MYSVVLFDLDGTLTEPKEGITKCVQYALKAFNIEAELDALIPFIGPPLVDQFMAQYGFTKGDALKAVALYRERFSTVGMFENKAFEGIEDILERLVVQGKTLGVATSKPEVYARPILERYGLSKYFKVICGSELDGTRNAKAEVIAEALIRLGLSSEDKKSVLMVGDRFHDVKGAMACGIDVLGVNYGYAAPGELKDAGATYVVESMADLADFFFA